MRPALKSKRSGKIYISECIHDISVVDEDEDLADLIIGFINDDGEFVEQVPRCPEPTG